MLKLYVTLWNGEKGPVTIEENRSEDINIQYPPLVVVNSVKTQMRCTAKEVKEIEVVRTNGKRPSLNFNHFTCVDVLRFKQPMRLTSFMLMTKGPLKVIGLSSIKFINCEFNSYTEIEDLDKVMENNPNGLIELDNWIENI